jgi:hypothetical protein
MTNPTRPGASRHLGAQRAGWGGRLRRPVIGLVSVGMVVAFTFVTPGGSGPAGAAGGAPKLATSGPADEGPYPWKYPATGNIKVGSGKTVGGQACTPGTPQFASPYADPCIPKFTGNNGGATYRGVTASTITLAVRQFPETANAEQLAAMAHEAGDALPSVTNQVQQVFLNYFNKVYDLYGRKVVLQPFTATGNSTAEALDQGQAQACADATTIVSQMHAFGEAGLASDYQLPGSGPFSQCAANDKLVEFEGDLYFNEGSYQKQNPYVWSTTQDCTRVSTTTAEVEGTLLAGKKAVYAGDPTLASETRKFATYVPNVPQYISCTKNSNSLLVHKYDVPASQIAPPFFYNLDVSTFAQSAQEAVVQFKAAGVTTVIVACDPYSAGLLTKAAAAQDYHPEWFIIGSALTDQDQYVQSQDDATEVQGHLFGMSEQSSSTETFGPASLAGVLYKKLTGHVIPPGTDGNYSQLVEIFDMLQAAGPDLTPQNMARGIHALPELGAPAYQYGSWTYNLGPNGTPGVGDHTASNSARFVYWDGTAISKVNGIKGTYVALFNNKRFVLGAWPKTLPPLFTAPGSAATAGG